MNKVSKKKNNKSRKQYQPSVRSQLGNSFSPYQSRFSRLITANAGIYIGSTGLYSFATAANTRYWDYAPVFVATEFSDISKVFDSYKITALSVTVCYTGLAPNAAAGFHMLYMITSPSATATTNPTNSDVMASEDLRLFSTNMVTPQQVTYKFNKPAISGSTGLWSDVDKTLTYGLVQIGNDTSVTMGATTAFPVFDVKFDFTVEFGNPK
jgi:hypothetical protein